MLDNITEVRRVIRKRVLDNLGGEDAVCFTLDESTDAGPNQRGDLFDQNKPFYMVEIEIDEVVATGPGSHAWRRVMARVDLAYLTKDRLDDLNSHARLEAAGGWFADQTLDGIRFRNFVPIDEGRFLGFQRYTATVPFECEIKPKGA